MYALSIAGYKLLHFRFQVSFTAPSKTLSLDWRIEAERENESEEKLLPNIGHNLF